jgi:hypothetical protein
MRITQSAARVAAIGIVCIGVAGAGVAAVSAKGDGGKVIYVAGACNHGTATMGILTQSGHRAQIAFGASSEGAYGDWHVVVDSDGDAGPVLGIIDIDTGTVGTTWTVVDTVELPRGRNTLTVSAHNAVSDEWCTAQFVTKV